MIVYGKQVCLYILKHCPQRIKEILFAKDIESAVFSQFAKLQLPTYRVDSKKAQALCKGGNHQGFLLRIEPPEPTELSELKGYTRLLLLEGVTDTHNIGAVFRSAYALGFEAILLTAIQSFALEGAIRTSSGAALHTPFALCKDSLSVCNELKLAGFTLLGAVSGGDDWHASTLPQKLVLCLGSEGEGLRKRLLTKMHILVSIGLRHNFDSLNISAAAAILMDRIQNGR
ncbi:MAG: RNA methyltransferase [Helicobacter sp.]|nr:RNA methyltransferase [Helicobacter sp.]